MRLVTEAEKAGKNIPIDVASLREQVVVAGRRETELHSNQLVPSNQMAQATAELHWARNTIYTQSKNLTTMFRMKSSMKCLEENVTIFEASEKEMKIEVASLMKDITRFSQLVDDILVEVVDLPERLGAKDGVIWSSVEHLCAFFWADYL